MSLQSSKGNEPSSKRAKFGIKAASQSEVTDGRALAKLSLNFIKSS